MSANALTNIPAAPVYAVSDIERMAHAFAVSKLFGVSNVEQAIALCLIAQAEGRHPASAAQDYHIIQGKPSKKADAMLRDFLTSGGKVEWHELTDEAVSATFSHPAGGSVRIDWDMARARQAQISTPMWKKYPRQMLRARVVSEGVRTVFPMATSGMYVPEEVQEFTPAPATAQEPIQTAEFTEVTPEPKKSSAQAKRDGDWEALTAEVDACSSAGQLDLLVSSGAFVTAVKALPSKWVKELREYVAAADERLSADAPDDEPEPETKTAVAPNFDNLEPIPQ